MERFVNRFGLNDIPLAKIPLEAELMYVHLTVLFLNMCTKVVGAFSSISHLEGSRELLLKYHNPVLIRPSALEIIIVDGHIQLLFSMNKHTRVIL
jgi:hypothetical protein